MSKKIDNKIEAICNRYPFNTFTGETLKEQKQELKALVELVEEDTNEAYFKDFTVNELMNKKQEIDDLLSQYSQNGKDELI